VCQHFEVNLNNVILAISPASIVPRMLEGDKGMLFQIGVPCCFKRYCRTSFDLGKVNINDNRKFFLNYFIHVTCPEDLESATIFQDSETGLVIGRHPDGSGEFALVEKAGNPKEAEQTFLWETENDVFNILVVEQTDSIWTPTEIDYYNDPFAKFTSKPRDGYGYDYQYFKNPQTGKFQINHNGHPFCRGENNKIVSYTGPDSPDVIWFDFIQV
jgi:hypothetical protein